PKGVMISHRAALNTVADVNRRLGAGPGDRVLALAALGFDLSVYDLFGPPGAGGAIVLPAAERRGDPSHWAELAREHRVTLWNSVPAQMSMLTDYLATDPQAAPDSLRAALLSGAWIPVNLTERIRAPPPDTVPYKPGGATLDTQYSNHYPLCPTHSHSL